MSDHAKRLGKIGAAHAREEQIVALGCEPSARHAERGWLLAEHRAASEALAAAGIPEDMGSLAERVALLHHDADQQTSLTSRLMEEQEAASGALAAAGIPGDRRTLAERITGALEAVHEALDPVVARRDVHDAPLLPVVTRATTATRIALDLADERDRLPAAEAERDRFKGAIVAANNALAEVCHGDHEHQIECHADTLPAQYRRVAAAAEQASGILAEVVLDIVEQGSQAGASDAAEAAARCARGEHRKAGETMPGSCADCGVDWGDLDTEDETDELYAAHPLIWADRVKAMASAMPETAAAVFRKAVDRAARVPGLEQANREAHQGIAKLKQRLEQRSPTEAALPDIGIAVAHGATAQALAEDVASQVLHVVSEYALADPATLAPDALALRAKLRARLGLDGAPPSPSR